MPDFDEDIIEPAMAAVQGALSEFDAVPAPEDFGTQAGPLSISLKLENGDELIYKFKDQLQGTTITIDRYDAPSFVVTVGE